MVPYDCEPKVFLKRGIQGGICSCFSSAFSQTVYLPQFTSHCSHLLKWWYAIKELPCSHEEAAAFTLYEVTPQLELKYMECANLH